MLPSNPTESDIIYVARAYILQLISGVLMSDSNQNKVHIMYFPLLEDLNNTWAYSWSSTVLAMLYSELCRAIAKCERYKR